MSTFMNNKQLIIHVATEVIVVSSIFVIFRKRINNLNNTIDELKETIERQEQLIIDHDRMLRELYDDKKSLNNSVYNNFDTVSYPENNIGNINNNTIRSNMHNTYNEGTEEKEAYAYQSEPIIYNTDTANKKIKNPKSQVKTPRREVKTPRREVKTPRREVKKPRQEVKKPRQEVKKPRREVSNFKTTDLFPSHMSNTIGIVGIDVRSRPVESNVKSSSRIEIIEEDDEDEDYESLGSINSADLDEELKHELEDLEDLDDLDDLDE